MSVPTMIPGASYFSLVKLYQTLLLISWILNLESGLTFRMALSISFASEVRTLGC